MVIVWTLIVGLVLSVTLMWLVLAVVLLCFRPRGLAPSASARMLPDCVRLVTRVARDRDVPRAVRWRLGVALTYVVSPVNLVPNVIPVLGLIDTVVVCAWALRATARLAGPEALVRHWPGDPGALALLCRVLRVPLVGVGGVTAETSSGATSA